MVEFSCICIVSSIDQLISKLKELLEPDISGDDASGHSVFATPVFGEPLLLVEGKERVLVAADLHLGLEYELWLGGISIPSQTEKILRRL